MLSPDAALARGSAVQQRKLEQGGARGGQAGVYTQHGAKGAVGRECGELHINGIAPV